MALLWRKQLNLARCIGIFNITDDLSVQDILVLFLHGKHDLSLKTESVHISADLHYIDILFLFSGKNSIVCSALLGQGPFHDKPKLLLLC